MPHIHLTTVINAPVERVFNLSRSIDLHQQSMSHTNEKAIAGRTHGLIEEDETVTWQARHFFTTRRLTVTITQLVFPNFFQDEMIAGDFKKMRHEHWFVQRNDITIMTDEFHFEAPYSLLGQLANKLFLTFYMKNLLITRNNIIKQYAETEQWKTVLHEE